MKRTEQICVIGGGVSGLSTAIILLEAGFPVQIVSKHHPIKSSQDPFFLSTVPSASIIPHSIYTRNMEELFKVSQRYFEFLKSEAFPGITTHRHFELFAVDKKEPAYINWMHAFTLWSQLKNRWHPSLPGCPIITGWAYECIFADWKLYFPALFKKFLSLDGTFSQQNLSSSDLRRLKADIIINCSELGSISLFGDQQTNVFLGHLLKIEGAPILKDPDGKTVSYNFTPTADLYSDSNGNPMDIYCYPRQDGWILGGSRLTGSIQQDGTYSGEQPPSPLIQIGNRKISRAIPELNRKLIEHSFQSGSFSTKNQQVISGYRYIRSLENGLRLEAEEKHGKLIIHNYGHGGAGVTLSWGCALEVRNILQSRIGTI